jgi:hypothetical protein
MHSGSSRPDREHVGRRRLQRASEMTKRHHQRTCSHGAHHEAAVWTMPHSSVEAGLAGAAACDLAMGHERASGSIRASNSVSVWGLRSLSRPLFFHPCGAGMAAREPISLQLAAGLETGLEAWEILAGEVSAWCKMAQLHESSSAGSSRRLVRHAEASRLRSRISHLGPNWTGWRCRSTQTISCPRCSSS